MISLTKEFGQYATIQKGSSFKCRKVIPINYKKVSLPYSIFLKTKKRFFKKYKFHKKSWFVTFIGSTNKFFDFDTILNAAKETYVKDKKIIFLIVGDGISQDYLRKRILNEDIKNVILTGWVDGYDLETILRLTNLGLAPYKNLEGFNKNITNKIFEYLAHSIPTLISNSGKMKRFVTSNKIGFYFRQGDFIKLSTKIIELKNNKNEYNLMKNRCSNLYKEKFHYSKSSKLLKDFINKINI